MNLDTGNVMGRRSLRAKGVSIELLNAKNTAVQAACRRERKTAISKFVKM